MVDVCSWLTSRSSPVYSTTTTTKSPHAAIHTTEAQQTAQYTHTHTQLCIHWPKMCGWAVRTHPKLHNRFNVQFNVHNFFHYNNKKRKKPEKRRERKKHSGCVFLFIWYMRTRHECLATQMLTYIRYVYVHFSHGRWLCLVAGLGNT